jgi:hypothetical protein
MLWIGIGCGLLLFVGLLGGGIVWYVTAKAKSALEEIAASAAPLVPGAPSSAAGSPEAVAGSCAKAVACCKLITAKSGANAQAAAACEPLAKLADAQCASYYRTYKQSAKLLGIQCE